MATTHTLSKGSFIRPYRRVNVETFKEGASQSFKKGYPLKMSGVSGYESTHVVVMDTDNQTTIIGIAAEDATGTTGSPIAVYIADGSAEFSGVLTNGASAGTADGNMVGAEYGLIIDSSNEIWCVDYADTTVKIVRIIKLLDPDGDVSGRVVFKFKSVITATENIYGAA